MTGKTRKLTHLDPAGRPTMVDVSAKAVTAREAKAECRVRFPAAVAEQLQANCLRSAKGAIVDTAVIAGTMAVKRTHELIPFCHPLPVDGIEIGIVWRDAQSLDLWQCASEVTRLAGIARSGHATRDVLTGSTITITSLGSLGGIVSTPIINHPEVAIVGVNKIMIRPMWDGTQFVPRKMMNLSSSFDHRVIDGWDAAVFVQRLKALLEAPAMIFVEG